MGVPTDNTVFGDFTSDVVKPRFEWASIEEPRWNQAYPFQLAVLKATETGYEWATNSNGDSAWFTLPIPPEAMATVTPFAITVQPTLGGVVEQHGGAPLRQISMQGSFGVLPGRGNGEGVGGGIMREFKGIAGGTIEAAQGLVDSAVSIGSGPAYQANLLPKAKGPDDPGFTKGSSGYYAFLRLQRFLESYVEMKRTTAGKDLRLALLVWKEKAAYLVTPITFQVQRNATSPFEYNYSLQFTAWKRIDSTVIGSGTAYVVPSGKGSAASTYRTVLNRVEAARKTLQQARKVMRNVVADLNAIGNDLRQVSLVLKTLGAVVRDARDFPAQMRGAWKDSIVATWNDTMVYLDLRDPEVKEKVSAVTAEVGESSSGVKSLGTGGSKLVEYLTDPEHADFQALITPDDLPLSEVQRSAIDAEVERAKKLTPSDFSDMRRRLMATADKLADSMPTPTEDEFLALCAILDAADSLGSLVLAMREEKKSVTRIEYVAGLSTDNGLDMRVPRSKFAVPFPYNSTLEQLAAQYLDDATRWPEIAALNELREPYVDEVGVELPLLSNAAGNQVTVADASKLLLGQKVTLRMTGLPDEERRVLAVSKVTSQYWVVTLTGERDLGGRYTSAAKLHYFPSWTVNSSQVVYIPSDSEADADVRYVPNSDDLTGIIKAGDVDGMLTESGDLVITPDGDWPYVYGLAGIVQWARVGLSTRKGSMPLYPTFGIDAGVGESLAAATAEDVLASVKSLFGQSPAFTGVLSAAVSRTGPATRVELDVGVLGSDAILPLSFELPQ